MWLATPHRKKRESNMAAKRTLWSSLVIMAMFMELGMAANYTVGAPNGGWDTSTDLQTWASSQSFLVGDNLIFQYSTNHNVIEVRKAEYDSCQPSNPIQTNTGGTTTITLSSPGKRYFVCGTPGHCGQGQKVEIDTLATSSSSSPPPSASPPAGSNQSPQQSPSSAPQAPTSSSPESSPSELPSLTPPTVPSTGSSPDPSASPAINYKATFKATGLTMGFSLIVMMLLDF